MGKSKILYTQIYTGLFARIKGFFEKKYLHTHPFGRHIFWKEFEFWFFDKKLAEEKQTKSCRIPRNFPGAYLRHFYLQNCIGKINNKFSDSSTGWHFGVLQFTGFVKNRGKSRDTWVF